MGHLFKKVSFIGQSIDGTKTLSVFFAFLLLLQVTLSSVAPILLEKAEAARDKPKPLQSQRKSNEPARSGVVGKKLKDAKTTDKIPALGEIDLSNLVTGEIESQRTRDKDFTRNSDGTVTERNYLGSKYYEKDGSWEPIDITLEEDTNAADAGFVGSLFGKAQSAFKKQTTFKTKNNSWHGRFALRTIKKAWYDCSLKAIQSPLARSTPTM